MFIYLCHNVNGDILIPDLSEIASEYDLDIGDTFLIEPNEYIILTKREVPTLELDNYDDGNQAPSIPKESPCQTE